MFRIKLSLILLLTLVCRIANAQLCGATTVILKDTIVNDGTDYVLAFDEEFLGTTLNLGNWEIQQWSQGAMDGTGAYYTLDNVEVHPETFYGYATQATGVCRIITKKETVHKPAVSWDPNSPVFDYKYTSGNIWTIEKFGWGIYEFRCKVPKGFGFWPSIYMFGQQGDYGNEIDVFEFVNELDIFGHNKEKELSHRPQMHYHYYDQTATRVDYNCGSTLADKSVDYSQDFHTYKIVWDRWGLSWYIDGQWIKTAGQWYDINGNLITKENIKPAQVALRNDYYPRIDIQIILGMGVQLGNDSPNDTSPFPCYYDIDYVKYWKPY